MEGGTVRNRLTALLLALSAAFWLTTVVAVPAANAAGNCDVTVVDDAGKLGSTTKVQDAANTLANNIGAVVYVRTVTNTVTKLNDWANAQLAACPQWQNDKPKSGTVTFENAAKANLLVFAMSMAPNREVAIYYGGNWTPPLAATTGRTVNNAPQTQARRIQDDLMGARFKSGDFVGGFTAGMQEVGRVIDAYQHPVQPNQGGNNPPVVVNTQPTDYSGLWKVLSWIVALIALGFALYFGWVFYTRRKEERDAREEARQSALAQRDAATSLLGQLDGEQRPAVRDVEVGFLKDLGSDYASRATDLLGEIKRSQDAANSAFTQASSAAGSPDDTGLPVGVYSSMEGRYETAHQNAELAAQADKELHELYTRVRQQLDNVESEAAELGRQLDTIDTNAKSLQLTGIKVDSILDAISEARNGLMNATEMKGQPASLRLLDEAKKQVAAARSAHDTLVAARQQVTDDIASLQSRLDDYPALLQVARATFDRISPAYNQESWKPVKGNGTESERRASEAAEQLKSATQAGTQQDWEKALDRLNQGNKLMDEAEGLLTSIVELEKNLERAKTELPATIQRVKDAVAIATKYIGDFDDDIDDDLWANLKKAQELLAIAEAGLSEAQPRYLTNLKLALEAEQAVTHIHDQAVNEHEAMENLRQRAQSTLKAAKAEVSRAREFINDHKSDVNRSAKDALRDAESYLDTAKRATDPSQILAASQSATKEAGKAYKKAKQDFEDAEDERDRSYRSSTVVVGGRSDSGSPYGGSSWGSSSSGGGSSSSWGSSDSGGGSGSSFGGFDSGGGSSSSFGSSDSGGGSASGW